MAETAVIIDALKATLRSNGVTYAKIGKHLDLSESSVKRLFARQDLSLKRLDEICELVGVEISDLLEIADENRARIDMLDEDIEARLVNDPKLLLVAYCVVNYWTFDEILSHYTIDTHELTNLFASLDRMKIIEFLPGNRSRRLVSANFKWRTSGPIERFFQTQVQNRFLNSHFEPDDELRMVLTGMLTRVSRIELVQRLNRIAETFERTCADDRKMPLEDRYSTTLLIAMRPWQFEAFKHLERNVNSS